MISECSSFPGRYPAAAEHMINGRKCSILGWAVFICGAVFTQLSNISFLSVVLYLSFNKTSCSQAWNSLVHVGIVVCWFSVAKLWVANPLPMIRTPCLLSSPMVSANSRWSFTSRLSNKEIWLTVE